MLTDVEKQQIEAQVQQYSQKQAACIEALKIVQEQRGWVSDENIRDIAHTLEMTPDELDSVATFYNLIFRQPVGRHVIHLCDSVICWMDGYESLQDHLCKKLGIQMGETTPDGLFTLLPVCCIGYCDRAPAILINKKAYGPLTPEKLDAILDKLREEGGGSRN